MTKKRKEKEGLQYRKVVPVKTLKVVDRNDPRTAKRVCCCVGDEEIIEEKEGKRLMASVRVDIGGEGGGHGDEAEEAAYERRYLQMFGLYPLKNYEREVILAKLRGNLGKVLCPWLCPLLH